MGSFGALSSAQNRLQQIPWQHAKIDIVAYAYNACQSPRDYA
jgi:hypothetical protein